MASSPSTPWQIEGKKVEGARDFPFRLQYRCQRRHSRETERCWLLGRKVMTNLDSMLKSRDITLSTKVHLVKAMVFPVVMYGCEIWTIKKLSAEALRLLNCGVGGDSWESLGLQGDQTSQSWRMSTLNIHCKDWCWSWSSNTLASWCEKPTHWERLWCWERMRAGEVGSKVWDGWMISPTQWTISLSKLQEPVKDREAWCAACSSWDCKVSYMTEELNNSKLR